MSSGQVSVVAVRQLEDSVEWSAESFCTAAPVVFATL